MAGRYPKEFKEDVIRVARDRGPGETLEQIAHDFGVHPVTLSKWLRLDQALRFGCHSVGSDGPVDRRTPGVDHPDVVSSRAGGARNVRDDRVTEIAGSEGVDIGHVTASPSARVEDLHLATVRSRAGPVTGILITSPIEGSTLGCVYPVARGIPTPEQPRRTKVYESVVLGLSLQSSRRPIGGHEDHRSLRR